MRLTSGEYEATVERIEKINQRAEKRGFNGRIDLTATQIIEKYTTDLGFEVEEIKWDIEITGEPPRYNGWTFTATLEWDEEAGPIVYTVPGVKTVNRDNLRQDWCDHCRQTRHRKATYLVRNEAGEQLQVGSTCVKDFLGWHTTPVIFISQQVEDDLDDYLSGGSYESRWSVRTILAVAWAAIQVCGFRPSGDPDGSTKDLVLAALSPKARKLMEELRPYVAKSAEQAQIIHDWVLSDAFAGDNEYVRNLKAVAAAESASARNIGLLASAPQAWARAMERELAARQDDLVNEFAGTVGDRLELSVTIKAIRYLESQWGTTTLYTLVGDDRHVYKWFATKDALGPTANVACKIKGTVKKHDEHQGAKTTVLTRCKVVS